MASATVYTQDAEVAGSVRNSGTVYATVRGAATGDQATVNGASGAVRAVSSFFSPTYFVQRGFIIFNLASIPVTAVVSAVTVSLFGNSKGGDDDTAIVESTQAATNNLTTADFDAFNSTELASRVTTWSTSGYNDYTLNASGIALVQAAIAAGGYAKFCLRNKKDIDNNTPAEDNTVQGYGSQDTGTTHDPKIVVTYTPPTNRGNPIFFSSGGIGVS